MKAVLTNFLLRSLVWCVPVFFTWILLASTVLVPTAVTFNRLWVENQYPSMQFRLERKASLDEWQLSSSILFQAQREYPHNSYQPTVATNGDTVLSINNLLGYSLGFALSWLLILIMSANKLPHLCYASVIQLGVMVMAVACSIEYKIISLLMDEVNWRILTDAHYIVVPDIPPQWQVTLMKTLADVSASVCVLVAPVVIGISFGRPFIYAQLLVTALGEKTIDNQTDSHATD